MTSLAEALAHRLEATRQRTRDLLAPLGEAGMARTADPIMSPPLWDLGHIAAYEELWLVCRLTGRPGLHPERASLYDAAETPRAARADAPLLDLAGCDAYLAEVRARALEALEGADLGPDADPLSAGGFVFDMVAQHEAQHTETVLQTLALLPAGEYAPPRRPAPADGAPAAVPGRRVEVPAGAFAMGAGEAGFAYDCERPRHARELPAFAIARHPVSNAEHLAFIADGGYRRPELWTEEGWGWRCEVGAEAPLGWERDGEGGWLAREFDVRAPVDPARPVQHVSAHEADAHARWAGARLPSEAEWERAALLSDDPAAGASIDQLAFGPAPCREGPGAGCRGMVGDVWEWTSSTLDGYPGFRAFPYREYAEVFFGPRYRVLRGGSWATQPQAARISFRNWDLPRRRQIFAGMRLAWDLA